MKNKTLLLFAAFAMTFGFLSTASAGHYDRHHHAETVVRYYDSHDGYRYQVVRYYDHHCRSYRERHVRIGRCYRPRPVQYCPPTIDTRRTSYRGRNVIIGGSRYNVDSRRGVSRGYRSCR